MATVRVMSWNIQNFGQKKAANNAIVECIANTAFHNDVDLLIIVEARSTGAIQALSATLNTVSATAGDYKGYFYSPKSSTKGFYSDSTGTHYEYFGFIDKDAHTLAAYGFAGPLASPNYYVNARTGLNQLMMTSGETNAGYTSSLYLYNQDFAAGRPPCWGYFEQAVPPNKKLAFNVIALHLRPDLKTAAAQMKDLLKFDLLLDVKAPLIITGDFNTESGQILSRDDMNNISARITKDFAQINCHPVFDRNAMSTHVSGEVYDNFYVRNYGNSMGNAKIISPVDVIEYLPGIINAQADLVNHVANFQNAVALTANINNLFANGIDSLSVNEIFSIYGIISDHYPITIDITKT
jgi:hypothetical protein